MPSSDPSIAQWENYDPDSPGTIPPELLPDPSKRAFLDFQPAPNANVPHIWLHPNNDDGRAACFLAHFGQIIRFCPELERWRVWHEHQWHDDTTGRVGHYAQILSRWELAAFPVERDAWLAKNAKMPAKEQQKIMGSWTSAAATLGNEKIISALLASAARQPSAVVPLASWDANHWTLGVKNGTVDLKTGEFRPGRAGDYITKSTATEFDPGALCPRWERFLGEVLNDDAELVLFVQRFFGYCLTGEIKEQFWLFLQGAGSNGKSILVENIVRVMGDYATKSDCSLFVADPKRGQQKGQARPDLVRLNGVRLTYASEPEAGCKLGESSIKEITGNESITARNLWVGEITFIPTAKLVLLGNTRPDVADATAGTWRRIGLINFEKQFLGPARDLTLEAVIAAEYPGILAWLVRGCLAWKSRGLDIPESVRAATEEYQKAEDMIGQFLEETVEITKEPLDFMTKAELWAFYDKWAAKNKAERFPSMISFGKKLSIRGIKSGRRMNDKLWLGLKLLPEIQSEIDKNQADQNDENERRWGK